MKAFEVEYPGDGYEIETGMDLVYGNNRKEARKTFLIAIAFLGLGVTNVIVEFQMSNFIG